MTTIPKPSPPMADQHREKNVIPKTIVFIGGTEICKDRLANAYANDRSTALIKVHNKNWSLHFHHTTITYPTPNTASEIHDLRSANDVIDDAHGIVLLYFVSSLQSFKHITHVVYKQICKIRSPIEGPGPATRRFGCVLVGLNFDPFTKEREVSVSAAEQWAMSQGVDSFELQGYEREDVKRVMQALVKSMIWATERNARDLAEDRPASSFDDILGRLGGYE